MKEGQNGSQDNVNKFVLKKKKKKMYKTKIPNATKTRGQKSIFQYIHKMLV